MKDLLQLHVQLSYRPFRPFWLETIGGTRIRVIKPEWFIEVPGTDKFLVFGSGFVTFGVFSELTEVIQVEDPSVNGLQ